jgi:hypothetical protein
MPADAPVMTATCPAMRLVLIVNYRERQSVSQSEKKGKLDD